MRAAAPAIMVTVMALGCASANGIGGPSARGRRSAAPGAAGGGGAGAAAGGGAPVELSRASLGPLSVGKWRLPNGLTLVLVPDPTATSVSYTTWFRVGSRDEDEAAGETGLAHLFEHLMFTQTKNHPVGEFDRAIEAAGGNSNAMTYYDFTAYMDDVPPAELAVAVRLEADRMVNLDLRKRQVDNERDVVVEERLSSVEDSVDGVLDELMYKQAFKTHPYRWPVIGWMKDIKAVTPEKAVAFYRRFYAPDNAVVIIAGRFEEAAALTLVSEAYGRIPSSSGTPRAVAQPELAPAAEVRAVVTRPVPADRVAIGFPAPALGDPERAAYEIIAEILAGGPSSRLQRELVVDKALASSVHGDVAPTKDPGLYALWIQMTKGHAAEEAETRVLAALADLAARPVSAAALSKAQARLETAFWRDLASSHGRAERLGEFEIATGDFRRAFARGDELARVTAADVQRVATKYLARGARSVVIARSKAGEP
ncbi:MAG TPA: pitrilysin family protein [Polyangia bacterium]|jgi:zinc protease|nr:pitrilysin family protein [Polyangia bacterium]